MDWYKTLNIWQKINLKELCPLICDIKFEDMGCFFSFKEKIDILYNKLKLEGFDV